MTVRVLATGLDDVAKFFEDLPDIAEQAAVYAINDTAERQGLTAIRREMRKEIDFPAGYLETPDRMRVSKRASKGSLEAIVTARDRPTSLARFAPGQTAQNTRGRGVRVKISKTGGVKNMRGAFVIDLKNGNRGVAVRLKPGAQLRNSSGARAVGIAKNLYLLYGPSVDQVFSGVIDQDKIHIDDILTNQFLRQFARLTRG